MLAEPIDERPVAQCDKAQLGPGDCVEFDNRADALDLVALAEHRHATGVNRLAHHGSTLKIRFVGDLAFAGAGRRRQIAVMGLEPKPRIAITRWLAHSRQILELVASHGLLVAFASI
jgi:hypothetical protein